MNGICWYVNRETWIEWQKQNGELLLPVKVSLILWFSSDKLFFNLQQWGLELQIEFNSAKLLLLDKEIVDEIDV